MNILFSNASLMWAGNEKWTLRAAETLLSRGHRVALAVRDRRVWTERLSSDLELIKLRFLNDADLRTVLALRRIIRERKVDVFLPTRSRDYWLGGWACMGTDAVYVMRNGITRDLRHTPKERLRYGSFPDGIIVNAEAVRQSLIHYPWVKADRVRVIYNGVDTPPCPPTEWRGEKGNTPPCPPAEAEGKKNFLIIAAGRVETDKRFDVLIEAVAIASREAPELRAVIFGKGDQEEPLTKLIRERELEGKVRLGGFTSELRRELQRADLAVLPSDREGVSNFILEAWEAGTPLVATAIPGSAEIVTDGLRGRLVPPGNAHKMAEAILEAVRSSEKRAHWAAEGKRAIETTFNWTRMAEEMQNFFGELISLKRTGQTGAK